MLQFSCEYFAQKESAFAIVESMPCNSGEKLVFKHPNIEKKRIAIVGVKNFFQSMFFFLFIG